VITDAVPAADDGEDYYRDLVADWPPLSEATRQRLAVLLAPDGADAT